MTNLIIEILGRWQMRGSKEHGMNQGFRIFALTLHGTMREQKAARLVWLSIKRAIFLAQKKLTFL